MSYAFTVHRYINTIFHNTTINCSLVVLYYQTHIYGAPLSNSLYYTYVIFLTYLDIQTSARVLTPQHLFFIFHLWSILLNHISAAFYYCPSGTIPFPFTHGSPQGGFPAAARASHVVIIIGGCWISFSGVGVRGGGGAQKGPGPVFGAKGRLPKNRKASRIPSTKFFFSLEKGPNSSAG